jgi:hypothetical protein
MTNHRACCCGPGPCVCTGCDFGTSYLAACMSWNVNWQFDPRRTDPCAAVPGCTLNDEEPLIHDVQVNAQYSFRSGPITRRTNADGTCCYRRVGTCDVTWSVTIVARGSCCQYPAVCTETRAYNGVDAIPYLLTVTPYCWQSTTCNWLHTISVCPVAVALGEFWLTDLQPSDCTGPLDCNNLPLTRAGLYLNGGLFQWRTAYKALNDIVWPGEMLPVARCPAGAIPVACGDTHLVGSNPFGLHFVDPSDWQTPTNCPIPAVAVVPYFGRTDGNCIGVDNNTADPCLGSYTVDEPCCFKEYTANANPPCYF